MSDKNTAFAVIAAFLFIFGLGYAMSFVEDRSRPVAAPQTEISNSGPTLDFSINRDICQYPNVVLAKINNKTDLPIHFTEFSISAHTKERSAIIFVQGFKTDIIIYPHTERNLCFEIDIGSLSKDFYEKTLDEKVSYVRNNYDFISNLVYSVRGPFFQYGKN